MRVEIVRQPIAPLVPRSRRSIEMELVRFPAVYALFARALWGLYSSLPPRSRLRQTIVRRFLEQGVGAMNRRDLEAAFASYHPDVESIWDHRFVSLGFEPIYRGRAARIAAQRQCDTEWGEWRLAPDEVIDLGAGRMLMLGRMGGRGVSSGVIVDTECAFLV